jgi:predicted DNA-binding transcriptional regulator AlpA
MSKTDVVPINERLMLSVSETLEATGLSRTSFYALVASGDLQTFTVGRSRYVPGDSLRAWIKRQVEMPSTVAPEITEQRSRAGKKGRAAQLGRK